MSEDLVIQVVANTGQANAALKGTQQATKAIGDEALATSTKTKSAFDGMSRNIMPAAVAYMSVRLAMRGVREVLQELDAAAKDDSFVSGKLKDAAMVASASVKSLETAFNQFKQTAVAAIAPVIGYIADDLSSAFTDSTKDIEKSSEMVNNFATAWGSVKTIVIVVAGAMQTVFGLLQGALSGIMFALTGAVKVAESLAYMVNKASGDAIKEMRLILQESSKELGEKAGKNLSDGFEKGVEGLSGKVFQKEMDGIDRYKNEILKKSKEIKEAQAQEAQKKETPSEQKAQRIFDPEDIARGRAASAIQAHNIELAKQKLLIDGDSTIRSAEWLESIKKQGEEIERNKRTREDQFEKEKQASEEHAAAIDAENFNRKQKIADEEYALKVLAAQYEQTQKTYDLEIAKAAELLQAKSTVKTSEPISTKLSGKQMAELNIGESNDDPQQKAMEIAKQRIDDALKAEREQLLEREDFKQEHADRIIEIEEKLNGGIIRIQNEAALKEAKLNKQRTISTQEMVNGISGALGNLATLMQSKNRTAFEIGRAAALAQNVIDTISSASSSYAFGARIGGPIVGAAFAATAVAAGAVRASMLLSAQPSGGGGNLSQGYNDTSNIGGPGEQRGAGVGASSQVNVSLYGERFGADQVRGLIDAINAETKDGKKVTVKV